MKWSELVQSQDPNIATSECVAAYTAVKQATHKYEVPTVAYGDSQQPPNGDRSPN